MFSKLFIDFQKKSVLYFCVQWELKIEVSKFIHLADRDMLLHIHFKSIAVCKKCCFIGENVTLRETISYFIADYFANIQYNKNDLSNKL